MGKRSTYTAVAAVVVAFVWAWYIWPRHDPVYDRFNLVSPTMTRAEIVEIMEGEPRGKAGEGGDLQMLYWPGINGMGIVTIDLNTGRATEVGWHQYNQCRPSIWTRLRVALGI